MPEYEGPDYQALSSQQCTIYNDERWLYQWFWAPIGYRYGTFFWCSCCMLLLVTIIVGHFYICLHLSSILLLLKMLNDDCNWVHLLGVAIFSNHLGISIKDNPFGLSVGVAIWVNIWGCDSGFPLLTTIDTCHCGLSLWVVICGFPQSLSFGLPLVAISGHQGILIGVAFGVCAFLRGCQIEDQHW